MNQFVMINRGGKLYHSNRGYMGGIGQARFVVDGGQVARYAHHGAYSWSRTFDPGVYIATPFDFFPCYLPDMTGLVVVTGKNGYMAVYPGESITPEAPTRWGNQFRYGGDVWAEGVALDVYGEWNSDAVTIPEGQLPNFLEFLKLHNGIFITAKNLEAIELEPVFTFMN